MSFYSRKLSSKKAKQSYIIQTTTFESKKACSNMQRI